MKKLFLFILFIPLVAIAEPDVSPPRQTYDDLLHRLERHPALEAVRQQVVEQREGAAGAVGLPDPMLMLGINNYPADGVGGFDRFAMTSKSLGFVQQIPNSGIRAATSLAKEHLAAKAELAVDYTRQQLKASLAIALAEHARVLKQKTLLDKEMKLLQQEAVYWEG
ncbi:MAG: hypothetical protein COY40_02625, partial [Alphaproteobacteria bacterium CG_4_10_14_0_8_um_filter_53_9]